MITKNQTHERNQLEAISIEDLVPKDHLVRKLDAAIDYNFIYPLVEHLYSDIGRPSVDPVVLFKMTFIQYVFGIRSMRQTIKEIETNVAYRWYLGFGFTSEIPHFSTFGKNYERRFKDTDIFEQIFYRILKEITSKNLLDADHVFIDSTHVKASANKKKFEKKMVRKETKAYEAKLQEELNIDRENNGKKPFPPEKFEKEEMKEIKESTTDPESGYYVKDERTKQFAYSFHTATDSKGFIVGAEVTPENVHDSKMLQPLVEKIIEKLKKPKAVAADAAYKTPAIANFLLSNNILPVLPYTRPKTKDGFLKKYEYVYDEYHDCYICPQDKLLTYKTTTKEGYRQFSSNPIECKNCSLLSVCTTSKQYKKIIHRHLWENSLEEVEHLRHRQDVKQIYAKRKETVERVFADAKEKHGMRWTNLRGLKKLSMQAMLIYSAMNLKKLANWTWKPSRSTVVSG